MEQATKRAVAFTIAPQDLQWQGGIVLLCDDGSLYYRNPCDGADAPWVRIAPAVEPATAEVPA